MWVWIVAFAPLIASLLAAYLTGTNFFRYKVGNTNMSAGAAAFQDRFVKYGPLVLVMYIQKYWKSTLLLSSICCFLDAQYLKKIGYNIGKLFMWCILIPVYLYKRSYYLRQNLTPLIVWIICASFWIIGAIASSVIIGSERVLR
jgi:hypothetical protein